MTEEEKEAFNYYKGCNEKDLLAFGVLGDISKKQVKYMELLLNLIEKQQEINQIHQKINGELRIKVKELEKLLEEKTLRIGFENSDDYVSKYKIKEKNKRIRRRKTNFKRC